ncbi:MAG TPA: hypothetical protein VGM39_24660 [Kofleriaceae bacterium]|jgi:hypothetical protein
MSRVALCFALVAAIGGCKRSKDAAPSCDVIGAKFLLVVRQQLSNGTLAEAQQRALDAQLPAMRDALVTACGDGAWGADVRTCLAAAGDHTAFEACEQHLTDAQRQKLAAPDAK